jgi:Na+/proline symporter
MTVVTWGWIFLGLYVVLMLALGVIGMRRTGDTDSYATARGSYLGAVLGLSYMAMVASGSTFMGIPGVAYESGFKGGYYPMLYPLGIFIGVAIVARGVKLMGDRMQSLTVPDFLGDFYRSPVLRAGVAIVSLLLIYYLMAQLAASGQMFEVILGIPYEWGITIAMAIILIYMVIGGTHSDILSDAIQGFLMLCIAVFVIGSFLVGFGVDGFGPGAVNEALAENQRWDVHTDPEDPTFANWWVILLLFLAHIGFLTLPHLGNKFFAMRGSGQVRRFVISASLANIVVGFLFLGGVLGAAIGITDIHPDAIIPTLFVELLPVWLAAFLCIAILSAIISTSDGLLMSLSMIFANDLYRKTWVPWRGMDPNDPDVDRRALLIGRVGVFLTGIVAVWLVWTPPDLLAIWMWVGIGGIITAMTAPLFLAVWWRGVTAFGAIASAFLAFAVYFVIHLGPQFELYEGWFPWNENPFASTAVGMIVGFVACLALSRFGTPLPDHHLDEVIAPETAAELEGTAHERPDSVVA